MGEKRIHIQAHRGACSEFVENTLPAFQRDIELKVDSIELDVHLSKEGEVVVYHDFELTPEWCRDKLGNPLNRSTPVWEMELAEIQALEIRVDRRLASQRELLPLEKRIPSLKEVCTDIKKNVLSKSHPVILDIEIKRHELIEKKPPSAGKMVHHVLKEIQNSWDISRTVLRSFDFEVLKEVQRQAPEIPIAVLTYQAEMSVKGICELFRPKILAPFYLNISAEEISLANSMGVEVIPYTVNTVQDFEQMIALGVSGLTTDNPKLLVEYLNR